MSADTAEFSAEKQILVTLGDKALEAFVQIVPPLPVEPGEIEFALAAAGVVFGVDAAAVREVALGPSSDPMLVARGAAPEPGQDAVVNYFFRSADQRRGKPRELADGRVDHRELQTIENVTKGQVLAAKTPARPAKPGTSVLGEPLTSKDGKDVPLRAGANVELSEDELFATALMDGQPALDGPRISVQPIVVVSGDVDYAIGNINFQGSVKISGNVLPGFTVKATQDIEIGGVVEGASLEAGGAVSVKGGVRQHSVVTAHGDVTAKFIDSESSVTTRSNIVVVESSMHSYLTAGLSIKIGKKLIGGHVLAGEYVAADEVGVAGGTTTVIDVRHSRQARVIQQIERAIQILTTQLATVNQTFHAILSNPNAPAGAYEKTREVKLQIEARLDQFTVELLERRADFPAESLRPVFVVSAGGFHPGVMMHLNKAYYQIDSRSPFTRISELNGVIHPSS
ncbi:MAG: FapA family protein [Candidatus Sericytochromatia bacterium]|nr:FapA family protein [Candidatus Sericytochromatia bacterium]